MLNTSKFLQARILKLRCVHKKDHHTINPQLKFAANVYIASLANLKSFSPFSTLSSGRRYTPTLKPDWYKILLRPNWKKPFVNPRHNMINQGQQTKSFLLEFVVFNPLFIDVHANVLSLKFKCQSLQRISFTIRKNEKAGNVSECSQLFSLFPLFSVTFQCLYCIGQTDKRKKYVISWRERWRESKSQNLPSRLAVFVPAQYTGDRRWGLAFWRLDIKDSWRPISPTHCCANWSIN